MKLKNNNDNHENLYNTEKAELLLKCHVFIDWTNTSDWKAELMCS